MKYLVNIDYTHFLISDHNTATSFAEMAKNYAIDKEKPIKVSLEVLTDEEAAEYEKGN